MRRGRIRLKRVYETPASEDGLRILVERLWPRGLRKEEAAADLWLKDVAPSTELRQWFGHDRARWEEFVRRYWAELDANPEPIRRIEEHLRRGAVTFVFAARDEEHNSAVALRAYLESGGRRR